MRRIAALLFLLAGPMLPGCNVPFEVSTAISDPDPALVDPRMSGVWYTVPIVERNGGYLRPLEIAFLQIHRKKASAIFEVIGTSATLDGANSVQWLAAQAYASRVDGNTYYNIQRVPYRGYDYTARPTDSFIIVKIDSVGDSAFFVRSSGSSFARIEPTGARVREVEMRPIGRAAGGLRIVDITREQLVAHIREKEPDRIFSEVTGPFYRLGLDPHELSPSSPMITDGTNARFGAWRVDCTPMQGTVADRHCVLQDEGKNVVISYKPKRSGAGTIGAIERYSCPASAITVSVDNLYDITIIDGPSSFFENLDLIESMHFGHVLRVDYQACPDKEMKHIEVSLDGFPAAFAMYSLRMSSFPPPRPFEQ